MQDSRFSIPQEFRSELRYVDARDKRTDEEILDSLTNGTCTSHLREDHMDFLAFRRAESTGLVPAQHRQLDPPERSVLDGPRPRQRAGLAEQCSDMGEQGNAPGDLRQWHHGRALRRSA